MAWRSVGENNADLIQKLRTNGVIHDDEVGLAMAQTDRKHYSPRNPYIDGKLLFVAIPFVAKNQLFSAPQSIGCGVTISAPHMHAFALLYLSNFLVPGAHVLDVGSGSGYLTACFARFIKNRGDHPETKVVGIEHQASLVALSRDNLNNDDSSFLSSEKVVIVRKCFFHLLIIQ